MASPLGSIPNQITLGRIAAVPVICLLVGLGGNWGYAFAFVLFLLAAVSDWLDGFLARRWGESSPLGRMLDPIADKLLVGAMVVMLAWTHRLGAWDLIPAIAILLREIFVAGLREFLGPRGVVVHVTMLAKWKTTTQLVAIGVILLGALFPDLGLISSLLLWLAGLLTVWTGFEYFRDSYLHLVGDET